MTGLLLDEAPLILQKRLAVILGVTEAILLQQLHYFLGRATTVHDGRKWVYKTLPEWRAEEFPFWSEDTIARGFHRLERLGVVETAHLSENKWDRKTYYTIDYPTFLRVTAASNTADCGDADGTPNSGANGVDPSPQIAPDHDRKLRSSSIPQEITQEITARERSKRPLSLPHTPVKTRRGKRTEAPPLPMLTFTDEDRAACHAEYDDKIAGGPPMVDLAIDKCLGHDSITHYPDQRGRVSWWLKHNFQQERTNAAGEPGAPGRPGAGADANRRRPLGIHQLPPPPGRDLDAVPGLNVPGMSVLSGRGSPAPPSTESTG